MIKAGVKFRMWVADWHAMANNKMGGDLEKIKTVGKYFIEVWRASGMDLSKVEFLWASDMAKNPDYWKLVLQVGKSNALKRFVRTAEMMGREESLEKLTGAHIIYSCMQVADIFMLKANITQLGMDQRKVNMLAREVGPLLGFWKPVVVSHHMLMGLSKAPVLTYEVKSGAAESAITRTIERENVKIQPRQRDFYDRYDRRYSKKINKAYCLEGDTKENPILEYCKYIIFESFDSRFEGQADSISPSLWLKGRKNGEGLSSLKHIKNWKKHSQKRTSPARLKNIGREISRSVAPTGEKTLRGRR